MYIPIHRVAETSQILSTIRGLLIARLLEQELIRDVAPNINDEADFDFLKAGALESPRGRLLLDMPIAGRDYSGLAL